MKHDVERDMRIARLLLDEMEPLYMAGGDIPVVDHLRAAATAILAPYDMQVTFFADRRSPRVPSFCGVGAFGITMKSA